MTGKEIIELYEDGMWTLRGALEKIADDAASDDVEEILRALPLVWRKEVELYIFDMYDNDIDSDDFFEIGNGEPDPELRRRIITALRAWIAKKKVTDSFTRDAAEP